MKRQVFALLALVSTFVGVGLQGSDGCYNGCGFGGFGCGEGNFYVGGFAGVNFLQSINKHHVDAKFKTGFAGGVSLGYEWQNNIRVEGEFAYRRNVLRSISFHDDDLDLHGTHLTVQTYTAMGNLLYDFDLCSDWTPYVGFGLGYAWNKVSISNHHHHHDFNWSRKNGGFAYQAIVGIGYKVFCETDIGLEYRYLGSKNDIRDHAIAISLRRGF